MSAYSCGAEGFTYKLPLELARENKTTVTHIQNLRFSFKALIVVAALIIPNSTMPSPNIIGHTHSFPSDKPRGGSIAPEKKYDERCPDEELSQSIAIIGLSLKFPQEASSAEGFWDMLMEKRCAMTEVPQQRYNIDAFHGTDSVRKDQVCIFCRCAKNRLLV